MGSLPRARAAEPERPLWRTREGHDYQPGYDLWWQCWQVEQCPFQPFPAPVRRVVPGEKKFKTTLALRLSVN